MQRTKTRGRGRRQFFEAESKAEDKILASRPACRRGLNIIDTMPRIFHDDISNRSRVIYTLKHTLWKTISFSQILSFLFSPWTAFHGIGLGPDLHQILLLIS